MRLGHLFNANLYYRHNASCLPPPSPVLYVCRLVLSIYIGGAKYYKIL